MRVRLRAFWLSWLLGCGTLHAGLFDDEEARRQITAQQASIEALRSEGRALEVRAAKLEEALSGQSLLNLHNQIESLRLDMNRLQGQIEVLVNESQLTQKRQRDFYVDLDSRLRRLEQPDGPVGPDASGTPETGAGTDAPADPTAANTSSTDGATAENRDYEAAYDLFRSGRYDDAIVRFREFIKVHPESGLVPGAHYWIGNAYYAKRDFRNAINTQEKLIAAFPASPKAPDAMLNIASSQQEINHKTAAKKTLEKLIAAYPGSEAAQKAKQRLADRK